LSGTPRASVHTAAEHTWHHRASCADGSEAGGHRHYIQTVTFHSLYRILPDNQGILPGIVHMLSGTVSFHENSLNDSSGFWYRYDDGHSCYLWKWRPVSCVL